MNKFNVILHVTTSCNYNCSYCDVIKDKKFLKREVISKIITFINRNYHSIDRFKFFGGEPLIAWSDIKYIIDSSTKILGNNFEIVTNTSLLSNLIGEYFKFFFKIIFFSIDTENKFNYNKVYDICKNYNLYNKLYINLVINPGTEEDSFKQFKKLYSLGFKKFNILPVYFTKNWSKNNLILLSKLMKYILNLKLIDKDLDLYGFQENLGNTAKLVNNSIFIDIDGMIYYSDIVTTYSGYKYKKKLLLGHVNKFNLLNLSSSIINEKNSIVMDIENKLYKEKYGQLELKRIMDYFSTYLNKTTNKNGL